MSKGENLLVIRQVVDTVMKNCMWQCEELQDTGRSRSEKQAFSHSGAGKGPLAPLHTPELSLDNC